VGQQGPDVLPDRQVQEICPHWRMLTEAFTATAIGLRPQAAEDAYARGVP
jgi:hypothetical protein